MRISDWSSDVCSSDLESNQVPWADSKLCGGHAARRNRRNAMTKKAKVRADGDNTRIDIKQPGELRRWTSELKVDDEKLKQIISHVGDSVSAVRSEEHTSELQSLMRNSYAVFCLKKKRDKKYNRHNQM